VLNYGASATSITFSDFFWGTLIGQIPNILIVTFFISAIKEVITEWNGFYTLIRLDFIIPFILFVSGFFVPKLIKRLFERRLIENNTPK